MVFTNQGSEPCIQYGVHGMQSCLQSCRFQAWNKRTSVEFVSLSSSSPWCVARHPAILGGILDITQVHVLSHGTHSRVAYYVNYSHCVPLQYLHKSNGASISIMLIVYIFHYFGPFYRWGAVTLNTSLCHDQHRVAATPDDAKDARFSKGLCAAAILVSCMVFALSSSCWATFKAIIPTPLPMATPAPTIPHSPRRERETDTYWCIIPSICM